jgi:hypothetical protein
MNQVWNVLHLAFGMNNQLTVTYRKRYVHTKSDSISSTHRLVRLVCTRGWTLSMSTIQQTLKKEKEISIFFFVNIYEKGYDVHIHETSVLWQWIQKLWVDDHMLHVDNSIHILCPAEFRDNSDLSRELNLKSYFIRLNENIKDCSKINMYDTCTIVQYRENAP